MKLAQLAEKLDIELDPAWHDKDIFGVNSLKHAQSNELSFLSSTYAQDLRDTKAAVVLVSEGVDLSSNALLLPVKNPDKVFAQAALLFYTPPATKKGIHPSAVIEEGAQIADEVYIGANVTVEASASIGAHSIIGAN